MCARSDPVTLHLAPSAMVELVSHLNLTSNHRSDTYLFRSLILDPLSHTIFPKMLGNIIMEYVEAPIVTRDHVGSLTIGYSPYETSSSHSHQLPRSRIWSPQDDSPYV